MTNSTREPKNWLVTKTDTHYYVRGLPSGYRDEPDTMLLARYDEGDCDSPHNSKLMHSAIYDLFQCADGLMEGDCFITPHGVFCCMGVHVVPVIETKNEAKARRARLRRLAK